MRKILPTNDLMFKKMMTSEGKEYILQNFIQVVTGMKLSNVKPTNPYQIQKYRENLAGVNLEMYQTIVDIAATTEEGIDIIIEMQLYKHRGFFERIRYYMASTYMDSYSAGHQTYKPVISIVVTDFSVFKEDPEPRVEIGLVNLEKNREVLNEKGQPFERVYLVNLATTLPNLDEAFNEWRNFLKNGTITAKASKEIQDAYAVVDFYNLDSEEMKMAEQMEKYEEVYWKTIEYAKETAREAGLKEGQVLAFLKMNLPITEIIKHTGLSEEEIQKIINTL